MTVRAQGNYVYSLGGKPQDVGEPWTLTRVGTGFRLQGQRLVKGKPTLIVDAAYLGTECGAMKVEWLGAGEPRAVQFLLEGGALEWRDGSGPAQRLMLPPRTLMFPLLRAATGPLLRALLDSTRPVVMPDLRAPRSAQFLRPLLSDRRTGLAAGAGGSRYRYFGGEYGDEGSDWWLDSHGLVCRYQWDTPQGQWDVRLEGLHADPGFSFS